MTVHHVIVAEPYWRHPDELDGVTLRHVRDGGRCRLLDACNEPHLWFDALWAIADDEGTGQGTRDLARRMVWDAEDRAHVWHGQPHQMYDYVWRVPVRGCGLEQADYERDLPLDLLPGVYAVTYDTPEWGDIPDVYLTDEPVPDPEAFL